MGEPELLADGRLRLDRPAEHVARLTIDNPGKRNALDHAILDAIAETLPRLRTRCLLLTAAGGVFSAGYDIGNLPTGEPEPGAGHDRHGSAGGGRFAEQAEALVAHPFHAAIEVLDAFPHPVVAALNGHALGGGLELALSCDLRVASDSAKVGMPPAKLGLVYSHTGLRKFMEAIGVPRTKQLFFTGRTITAREAHDWGLVNEVVPAEEVADRGLALAAEIAANAPLSLEGNKRIIRELLQADMHLDPDVERELVTLRESCFHTADFFEGVRAFAEKRRPNWQGR